MERRLAAILAADVVGYSRLMGEDEAGTLAALKSHREELIDPKVAAHHGRIVKLMGDGALVEFASVVDALECAIEIQRAMAERNGEVPEDRRIEFRVGINLGDVIVEGEDIYGDGVNIAARIEGLAEPRGICISGTAFDQVRNKLGLGFEYLGEQQTKNITEPVRVYRVLMEPDAAGKIIDAKNTKARLWRWVAAATVLLIFAVGGSAALWLRPWAPDVEQASVARMALPLPEKPSIAVLAFANLTGDPRQDYLSDGISESIITTLARIPDLFVIARNSSFTYKGKAVKVQRVAEELGVRYVLEGSVQGGDQSIRVTAQLIDALSGEHLWVDRYDLPFAEILALQDNISKNVATALQVNLTVGEAARVRSGSTNKPRAWEYLVQAEGLYLRLTPEDNKRAQRLCEQALALDPTYLAALVLLGWTHRSNARFGWKDDPAASYARAAELAERTLARDPDYSPAYVLLGDVVANRDRDYDRAIALIENAIALDAGVYGNQGMLGFHLILAGQPEKAIGHLKAAMRLSPFYPVWLPNMLGRAYQLMAENDKAIAAFKEVLGRVSIGFDADSAHAWMALAYAEQGKEDEARSHLEKALEINPSASVGQYRRRFAFKDAVLLNRRIEIWTRLGLPG